MTSRWIKTLQSQKSLGLRKTEAFSKIPKFDILKKQFAIFTDHQGIMRCTRHLAKAESPTSVKHPIFLGKDHHITSLIVKDSHKRITHGEIGRAHV